MTKSSLTRNNLPWPSPFSERGSWRGISKKQCLASAACACLLTVFLAIPLAAEDPPTHQLGPLDLIRAYTRTQLATAGFTRHEGQANDHVIVWWQKGEGPPLVMVHGVNDQAGTWFQIAPKLAETYRVLLVDLPGHGESEPASGPLQMTTVLGGFEAWLKERANGEPVTLVGNSMGAWIGLLVADRHPEWLRRLVVVNGGPLHFQPPDGLSLLPSTREDARAVMAALRDPANPAMPDPILDDLVRRVDGGEAQRMFQAEDDLNRYLMTDEELAEIRTPVDLVWGPADRYLGDGYPKRLMAGLPNARLQTLQACGHVPQAECPVPFLEVLTSVLASEPPGREAADPEASGDD